MKLSIDQRKLLAEFCANFAIAWFAAGLVAPILSRQPASEINQSIFAAIFLGLVSLITGVSLVRRGKR